MALYDQHVNYFGGSANYANSIKEKEATGQSLSDPAAASAFKAANPGLFSSGSGSSRSSGGSSSSSGSGSSRSSGGSGSGSGYNPAIPTTYQKYVNDMGAEGYAAAINSKLSDPNATWDDKAAATAFMADYPQYFPKPTVQQPVDPVVQQLLSIIDGLKDPQTPTAPTTNVEYAIPEGMTMEEALARAGQQLDPMTALARMNTTKAFASEREKLPQYLNARGQLFGGLRAGGESELTQREASALEQADLLAAANKSQVASSIKEGEDARAKSIADSIYQASMNNANLALSKWNTDMSSYNQNRQSAISAALTLIAEQRQREAAATAANQWQQSFGLQSDEFDYTRDKDAREWETQKPLIEAQTANYLHSANAPYGGSGGGSGSGGSGGGYGNSTADAMGLIDEAIANGHDRTYVNTLIANATPQWTADKVTIKTVQDYADTKLSGVEQKQADQTYAQDWNEYLARQEEYNNLPWYQKMSVDNPYDAWVASHPGQ